MNWIEKSLTRVVLHLSILSVSSYSKLRDNVHETEVDE
jgi:hypothetical protein